MAWRNAAVLASAPGSASAGKGAGGFHGGSPAAWMRQEGVWGAPHARQVAGADAGPPSSAGGSRKVDAPHTQIHSAFRFAWRGSMNGLLAGEPLSTAGAGAAPGVPGAPGVVGAGLPGGVLPPDEVLAAGLGGPPPRERFWPLRPAAGGVAGGGLVPSPAGGALLLPLPLPLPLPQYDMKSWKRAL